MTIGIAQEGSENPITIWKELGAIMTEHVTVTRINKDLEAAYSKLGDLLARHKKINLSDRTRWSNQFIAEGLLVVERLLVSDFDVVSVVATRKMERQVAPMMPQRTTRMPRFHALSPS